MALQYVLVAALGLFVGAAELISRYTDQPWTMLRYPAALWYLAINALAAVAALYAIHVFGWRLGLAANASAASVQLTQVLAAGFGAMALFRSSLFSVRVADNDIGIGPSGILAVFLSAADRTLDRNRAHPRAVVVGEIMKGVSFEKAMEALPTYCFALMQNLSADAQANAAKDIASLAGSDVSNNVKVLTMGLTLINVVGEDVLRAAVDSLRDEICGT